MGGDHSFSSRENQIDFLQVREGKPPTRANVYDAGIDFYVPKFTDQFKEDLKSKNLKFSDSSFTEDRTGKYFLISPHGRVLIPSGFKCRMAAPGRALIAANKSGIATKHGLIFGAQVVDYTYKGEIHISIINTTDNWIRVEEDQKIIQFLEMPVFANEVFITDAIEDGLEGGNIESVFYEGLEDDRGAGGFGSTDNI